MRRERASANPETREARLHLRPLGPDHREVDAVAPGSVGQEHVAAEGAFFGCTDARDRRTGPFVARISLQVHPLTAEPFERVRELQELRLRVHDAALV